MLCKDYWTAVAGGADATVARRFNLPADSPLVLDCWANVLTICAHVSNTVCEIQQISDWMNSTIRTGHAAAYGQVPGCAQSHAIRSRAASRDVFSLL
eukprot:4349844-Amphidinium_carterae.1